MFDVNSIINGENVSRKRVRHAEYVSIYKNLNWMTIRGRAD